MNFVGWEHKTLMICQAGVSCGNPTNTWFLVWGLVSHHSHHSCCRKKLIPWTSCDDNNHSLQAHWSVLFPMCLHTRTAYWGYLNNTPDGERFRSWLICNILKLLTSTRTIIYNAILGRRANTSVWNVY
jgi:hypothetical protein